VRRAADHQEAGIINLAELRGIRPRHAHAGGWIGGPDPVRDRLGDQPGVPKQALVHHHDVHLILRISGVGLCLARLSSLGGPRDPSHAA
jgi:hypothetical protein